MTPEAFRKDRYLRASGYNFYVFGAVNVLVTVPLFGALAGRPWPLWLGALFPIALVLTGFFCAALNDNRVGKMCGDPDPRAHMEAGALWGPVLLFGVAMTVVLVIRGPAAYIQPLWLSLIGMAYLQWGIVSVPEFRWLGWAMLAAGAGSGLTIHPAEIPFGLASRPALVVWIVFSGALWVPFGAYINWKYLHSR